MITDFESQLKRMPHGEARMAMHRAAIKEADENGEFIFRFYRRYEYIRESMFHWDFMEGFTEFPKMMQIFDEAEAKGLTDDDDAYSLLWAFKWLLENCKDYYQVSIDQFESFCTEYRKRLVKHGYNLRTYYQKRVNFYHFIDEQRAQEYFAQYQKQWRDRMSDCAACDRNDEVNFLLQHGKVEEAKEKAQALFEYKYTCAEMPQATYKNFTLYNLRRMMSGYEVDLEEATQFCKLFSDPLRYQSILVEAFGVPMIFLALTDPSKALTWYKRFWSMFETMRNPGYKFYFAIGAVIFFKKRSKATYKMNLPTNFPLYREDNTYNVQELVKYYYNYALDVATKLDARNGSDYYRKELDLFCGEI